MENHLDGYESMGVWEYRKRNKIEEGGKSKQKHSEFHFNVWFKKQTNKNLGLSSQACFWKYRRHCIPKDIT